MRKLASVQRIEKLEPIEGADFIEKASVLGWSLVVKKGEFREGDLCVYFEIDSLLPQHKAFDFINRDEQGELMKESSRKLRTKKLKGVISQGLALPLPAMIAVMKDLKALAPGETVHCDIGQDLTEAIGVSKYEPPLDLRACGNIKGKFPFYVPKTDEVRIQSVPEVLNEIRGKSCYISVKIDGTSSTFSHNDGEFHVCSRNMSLKDSVAEGLANKDDFYWAFARKYNILERLKEMGNCALQGEICGPGIRKNRLNLKEVSLFLFDVYLIDKQEYGDLEFLRIVSQRLGIPMVPVIADNFVPDESVTVESLLKMAEGKYEGTTNEREGIVIRTVKPCKSEVLQGRMSFKVVSNRFLLKGGE